MIKDQKTDVSDDDALYAAVKFKQAENALLGAQRALRRKIDEIQSLVGLQCSDVLRTAIEDGAAKALNEINKAIGKLDQATSVALSGSYHAFWLSERAAVPNQCDFRIKNGRILVRLPKLPVAGYRNTRSNLLPFSARCPQLEAFLATNRLPELNGEVYLFILHSIEKGTNYRRVPDFDNYDTKWLIDTLMLSYGGDNLMQYTLFNRGTDTAKLSVGTYAVLGDVATISDIDLAILQEALEDAFPAAQGEDGAFDVIETRKTIQTQADAALLVASPDDSASLGFGSRKTAKPKRKHKQKTG